MLVMNEDLTEALNGYIFLLKRKKYFEAHEVLEEAWHPLRLKKDPLANCVKGFINGAIAFEHIKRNKTNMPSKAQRVIASYLRYRHLVPSNTLFTSQFREARYILDRLIIEHAEIFKT